MGKKYACKYCIKCLFCIYICKIFILEKLPLTTRAHIELLQKDHTGNKLIKLCVFNALCNISKQLV